MNPSETSQSDKMPSARTPRQRSWRIRLAAMAFGLAISLGLLKALGAPRTQIMGLFLTESALLSIAGAFLGFILAFGAMELLAGFFPEYNLALAPWSPFVASAQGWLDWNVPLGRSSFQERVEQYLKEG